MLCAKSEAEKIIKDMQQRANEEVCSLQFLFGYKAPIVPRVYAREYPMGFAVESDLYYDGELLRHYPIPEEMLIDLIWFSIKKMGEN